MSDDESTGTSALRFLRSGYNSTGVVVFGKLYASASNAERSGFSLPGGVSPTSPNDGDLWSDGTDILIRLSGVTYKLDKTAA